MYVCEDVVENWLGKDLTFYSMAPIVSLMMGLNATVMLFILRLYFINEATL